ncbi:MAG: hypothetical protein NTX81_02930 [Candidatus Bathyarchaeota archaeon]|jgi:hypothetical protein|nr:hypothetical protein [Candidatus Bathyarchaeota archaeon]
MPTCTKCGKANPKRAKFCYDCGSSMYPMPSTTYPSTVTPTISVQAAPKPSPAVRVIAPTGTPQLSPAPNIAERRTVSMKIPSMGNCSYHRELPAMYICGRCGRRICKACGRQYLDMMFCSQCYGLSVPQPRYY